MTGSDTKNPGPATVLIVEDTVLVRLAIAAYLRDCGYRVIEAASSDEAILVLQQSATTIDILFSDADVAGALDAFSLCQWSRKNRPETKIVMAASPKGAAVAAGKLCEEGPYLAKPYEPQAVEDYIRRLLALQSIEESS
ncbi:response regulator [Hyphomicrobium sp. 2TAF46]|uniref:response regulator n=1 Tax=Hyphomicrobium sp. 2TAF46 TaxID=3233019 RepID=UPI003F8FD904